MQREHSAPDEKNTSGGRELACELHPTNPVPKGRLRVAQDVSPGFRFIPRQVPSGTAGNIPGCQAWASQNGLTSPPILNPPFPESWCPGTFSAVPTGL